MSDEKLSAVVYAFKALTKYIKPSFPLHRAQVLFYVAEHGPVTLDQIAKAVRVTSGVAYDDVRSLGNLDASGKAGARLIKQLPPAPDSTAHRFTLTERGRMAIGAVEFELTAGFGPEGEYEEDEPLKDYFAAVSATRV